MKVAVILTLIFAMSSCVLGPNAKHKRRMQDLEYLKSSYRLKKEIESDSTIQVIDEMIKDWKRKVKLTEKQIGK